MYWSISPYMHVLCVCVCAGVVYRPYIEEEGKEKSDDSRPLLGDNVPMSERAFWDIFVGRKLQNRGQYIVSQVCDNRLCCAFNSRLPLPMRAFYYNYIVLLLLQVLQYTTS